MSVVKHVTNFIEKVMFNFNKMRLVERLSKRLELGKDMETVLDKYSRIDYNNKMGALIEQAILDKDDKRIIVLAAPQNSSKTTITRAVARHLVHTGHLRGFTYEPIFRPDLMYRDAIFKSIIDPCEPESDLPIVDALKNDRRPALFILDQIEFTTMRDLTKMTPKSNELTTKFLVDLSNEMCQNTNPDRQFKIIAITSDIEATARYIKTPEINVIGGASCRMDIEESGKLIDAYASWSPSYMKKLTDFGRDKLVQLATTSGLPCVIHMFFAYHELESLERRTKRDDAIWRMWETLDL